MCHLPKGTVYHVEEVSINSCSSFFLNQELLKFSQVVLAYLLNCTHFPLGFINGEFVYGFPHGMCSWDKLHLVFLTWSLGGILFRVFH